MKRHRLIVGILAVVHLLLAALAFFYLSSHIDDWLEFLLLMLFPSQGILIGIWAALGKRAPLRVAVACVGIVVCLRIVGGLQRSDIPIAIFFLSLEAASMTVLLLLFRLTGLEMATTSLEPWRPTPFQFTIWQIMAWTVTVAVIMSALHYLPGGFLRFQTRLNLAIAAIQGSVAIMSIWLVFGNKWHAFRFLGVLVAIGTGTWLLYDYYRWRFGMLLTFEAAWTILSLLVVRWAGYRMTWHWRLRRFKEPSKSQSG